MYLLESFDESREEIGGSTSHLGWPMVEAPLVHESHLKHTTDSVLIGSFNSKTLFKDGDPVSLKLIFPGAIQTCEQYNIFTDKYTKQHKFIRQTQANSTYTFIQKHIHKHSNLTDTMHIQACTFTDNNKHVEQERTVRLSMIILKIAI